MNRNARENVDYNKIADSFSNSRKNLKWEEIDYFISSYLKNIKWKNFLDIWCGNGRLLEQFSNSFNVDDINYTWIDLSEDMLNHASLSFPKKEFLNIGLR